MKIVELTDYLLYFMIERISTMEKTIKVSNENGLPILPYTELQDFQGDLKTITRDSLEKLKSSIIEHGIFVSKKVWKDSDGICWTLDGHQTLKALSDLEKDGYSIPDIPIEYIDAVDTKDAITKLLQLVSEYGKVNKRTKFFDKFDMDVQDASTFELPVFNDAYLNELSVEQEKAMELDSSHNDIGKTKTQVRDEAKEQKWTDKQDSIEYKCEDGDIWQLGKQFLVCADNMTSNLLDKLRVKTSFNFDNVDMMFYDPPYQDDKAKQQTMLDCWKESYSTTLLIMSSRRILSGFDMTDFGEYCHDLIWDRVNPHLGANLQKPLVYHVPIDVYSKSRRAKVFNRDNVAVKRIFNGLDRIPSVLRIADQKRLDPLLDRGAKPVKLLQVLFSTYSERRIIDPCSGNGVTFVASAMIGRESLGIEIDKGMCNISLAYYEREIGEKPNLIGNINE